MYMLDKYNNRNKKKSMYIDLLLSCYLGNIRIKISPFPVAAAAPTSLSA